MWIIILLLLGLSPKVVWAKSYSIDEVAITNTVNRDGSMNVEEARRYNFSGSYSYAYEYINKKGQRNEPYLIDSFEVCETDFCYKQTEGNTGEVETFYVADEGSRYYVKWYYSATDQIKNFRIDYRVSNAVALNPDNAEIYWQAIGKDWDISQSNIKVIYNLPMGFDGNQIKAWGHGPLNGKVSIVSASEVDFESSSLNPGTFFENRLLLPKNMFTGGMNGLQTIAVITAEEDKFINQTKENIWLILVIASIVALIQLCIIYKNITNFWKYGKDDPLPQINLSGRWWEPPSEIDPAQVDTLLSGGGILKQRTFTAMVLSLVADRFYKINRSDQKEGLIFKKYKYFLEKISENKKKPTMGQAETMGLLDSIMLDTNIISFDEITDWVKSHPMTANDFFTSRLPEAAKTENLEEGFFNVESENQIKKYNFIIFYIFLGIGWFTFSKTLNNGLVLISYLVNGGLAILGIILATIFRINGEKLTAKGGEEKAKWIGFKKHLEEYHQTAKDPIDSVVLWEKYLVYGTVLGVSLKTISELPVNFSQSDQAIMVGYWGGSIDSSGLGDISASV